MEDYKLILVRGYLRNGDIENDKFLFEAKTCMKEQESFSIKKEWLDKLKQQTFAMNKEFSALIFNFGQTNRRKFLYIK